MGLSLSLSLACTTEAGSSSRTAAGSAGVGGLASGGQPSAQAGADAGAGSSGSLGNPLGGASTSATAGAGGASAGVSGAPAEICQKPHAPGRQSLELDVAGTIRRFLLYVPQGYAGTTPIPLLFNLHPSGGTPENHQDSTAMETFADERGFAIAALAGVDGFWNVSRDPARPDDAAFAQAVLALVDDQLCLDEERIYATGFSGGARTASRFACAMPNRIAAIAPVAGLRNDPPCDVSGIDVLTIHGTSDAINFYDGCPVADVDCSRKGEWVEGVEAAVSDWVASNGCITTAVIEEVASGVTRRSYLDCTSGSVVVFYRVEGGTHEWQQLDDTSQVVVDFLLAH